MPIKACNRIVGRFGGGCPLPGLVLLRFDHRFHYQIGQAARSELLAYYQHRILSAIAVVLHEYGLYHEDRELIVSTIVRCSRPWKPETPMGSSGLRTTTGPHRVVRLPRSTS